MCSVLANVPVYRSFFSTAHHAYWRVSLPKGLQYLIKYVS